MSRSLSTTPEDLAFHKPTMAFNNNFFLILLLINDLVF